MNMNLKAAAAALIATASLALHEAQAQDVRLGDIKRTPLMTEDLSVPGRQVVQVRVDFPPGAAAVRHNHPGEELVTSSKAFSNIASTAGRP